MTRFGFVPEGYTLKRYQEELKNLEKEIQIAADKINSDPSEANKAAVNAIRLKMENVRKDIERAIKADCEMKNIRDERLRRAMEAEAERRKDQDDPRSRVISIK